MLNIVIPMAGNGSRFAKAGYIAPKPLINVKGHYMIEWVVKNITPQINHKFIFICQEKHYKEYDLFNILKRLAPGCEIITVKNVTQGAACTVLLAEKFINNDSQLMIANSDQYVDIDINKYISSMKNYDGLIMTMKASDPKWSYIKYEKELITEIREKEVISDEATVGIYNFAHGRDFVKYAKQMIEKNCRVNNEFYVAPVYNEMIADCRKITFFNIGSDEDKMHGLGIPDDLNKFLKTDIKF